MDSLVTLLFLALWVVVAFFVLRFLAQRYFTEPRRADVAALSVAVAFALGALWPFSARFGGSSSHEAGAGPIAAASPPAEQVVTATVLGAGKPPGTRDLSAACRSVKGPFGNSSDGALDDLREDAPRSTIVADGGHVDRNEQYLIEGWAAEPGETRPALGVCLIVDGKVDARGKVYFGVARPDLGAGFHNDQVVTSGYVIVVPAGLLSAGKHRLQVISRITGGKNVILRAPRDVTAS